MAIQKRTILLNETEFTLGEVYHDSVQDVSGIALAGAAYLTGCDQILLGCKDNNNLPHSHWVDVTRISDVSVQDRPGGPAPRIPNRHP